jgi:Haem-NO-binding
MRGEIFNEFLEFAAEVIGPDAAAALTTRDGERARPLRYETAGRYDLAELVHLADGVAGVRSESRSAVLTRFGTHLFGYFAALYPTFLDESVSAIGLLSSIDTYVHGELRKLYPDAEFPGFECTPLPGGGLVMSYRSARPLADLADGLIRGCIEHFGDPIRVVREDLPGEPGTSARFVLVVEPDRN